MGENIGPTAGTQGGTVNCVMLQWWDSGQVMHELQSLAPKGPLLLRGILEAVF